MSAKSIYRNRELADRLGQDMDALRREVMAARGDRDAHYILRMIRWQRSCAAIGRIAMFLSLIFHPSWNHAFSSWISLWALLGCGTLLLGVAKILENMEIGHNILHGQWDWMGHPEIQSSLWEWDTACPSAQWKHSHNVIHHTWTNVVGRDRDVGYGILRMTSLQRWEPRFLGQFFYNLALALGFEYGVALHDLELDKVARGEKSHHSIRPMLRAQGRKIAKQAAKDYVLFPLLAGPFFFYVAGANVVANLIRNVWAYMIIFCGHFPSGSYMFTEEEIKGESHGQWCVRQILGSCNITGGPFFHILSGNLSHQIEHHLFPDMPSVRYKDVAPLVRKITEKYGLPYNAHSLGRQFGSTLLAIIKYSFPTPPAASDADDQGGSLAA